MTDRGNEESHQLPAEEPVNVSVAPTNAVGEEPAKEPFWDFKASHWVTALLTFGIFVVGVIQLCIYFRQTTILTKQADISAGQTEIMAAELRPWIKISDIKIVGPLTFGPTGDASVRIKINAVNVGKSVAFNVWPFAYLYVFVDGKPSHRIPANNGGVCDSKSMPESALDVAGDAVFPDETAPSDRTYSPHIEQGEVHAADAAKQSPGGVIPFFVIACVDYRAAEHHYKTGVTFMIGETGLKGMGIIPANGKTIPAESLYLIRVPGAFAS